MEYIVGQRWVSQTEPQMGLGLIVKADGRHITVHYPAIEEDRIYASNTAPLARIVYQAGDKFETIEQLALTVKAVEEMNGLLYYLAEDEPGNEKVIPETQLAATIQLSSPKQRLFSGQLDKNRLFQMRAASLHYRSVAQQSKARGLLGPRTNLLAHQLYIAHNVASRFAPRVLLADEVGLGKTIEAGMILHHQLIAGLASRIIIVVPEPLLHQWLVEMLRKFNLRFSLFDHNRYQSLIESGEANPFETEQLILCSIDLLTGDTEIAEKANAAGWDIAVVDEAHHLAWSPDTTVVSDRKYETVEALAKHCEGLLLLTATPEQAGVESHFARLRLLDPSKFHDLGAFKREQEHYVALNDIVTALKNEDADLTVSQSDTLKTLLPNANLGDVDTIVRELLDRHGTGRVLYRNTRAAIKNFPQRKPVGYPLAKPEQYSTRCGLYPEKNHAVDSDHWLDFDPRVSWLVELLKQLGKDKVLLICANAKTAIDLEHHLHIKIGIRSTAFYESLSIIERDRAAAYFADEESGAQVMICSEIGSEGRNFQFAHHLVLFDLPNNPDLLEQRIGRLDRIGQTDDIQIHVPYIKNSAQEYLYRWYHQGVNAFTASFSASTMVYDHFSGKLAPWLTEEVSDNTGDYESLLLDTSEYTQIMRTKMEQGRDQLLELNSCNKDIAEQLIEEITSAERSEALSIYMGNVFDNFGIDQDYHSPTSIILRPTEHMLVSHFPGMKDEGLTVTYDRETAQSREDMEFLTWEHPMVTETFDLILGSELGNATIGAIKLKALPAGTVMIECFFAMQCSAPKTLQIERFLPSTPIRVLLEASGKDLTSIIKHNKLNQLRAHVKKSNRFAIIKQLKPQLDTMINDAQAIADKKAAPLITSAKLHAHESISNEHARLVALKEINGAIRDSEIEFFKDQLARVGQALDSASAELQATRLIINTAE